MDITIGNILAFLIILFTINGLAVGLGVADASYTEKFNVFGQETTMENLESQYQAGTITVVGVEDNEPESSATTDQSIITGVPFTSNITTQANTFWSLLRGVVFGYAAIILMLPLGMVLTWILIGVIAFLQFGAIIYLLLYVFSIIRGGGGI
jgi:hypothetical protein